jgi:hypothetical protein
MKRIRTCIAAAMILATGPASALVGGRDDPSGARQAVMILGSKGGFCSAAVLTPNVLLTAGHCMRSASAYRVHYKAPSGEPVLIEPAATAVHPGYVPASGKDRRRSVDLALVPLPASFAPGRLAASSHPRPDEQLVAGGYGLGRDGDAATGGTFRSAALTVFEPYGPGALLVWLRDGSVSRGRNGAGACGGDSGGPVRDATGDIVAIIAFAEGAGSSHCGSLTQAVLVAPQRDWIRNVLAGWGEALPGE